MLLLNTIANVLSLPCVHLFVGYTGGVVLLRMVFSSAK